MLSLMSKRLMRTGLRRGLAGSNPWLVVGVAAGMVRLARRAGTRRSRVVFSEHIEPGATLVITAAIHEDSIPEDPAGSSE